MGIFPGAAAKEKQQEEEKRGERGACDGQNKKNRKRVSGREGNPNMERN